MGEHDAAIFHRYAEYLWKRAGGIVARWAVTGAVLGAAAGAVMLTSWADWPLSHRNAYLLIALGAVSGAVLGRSVGAARSLGLRLQAELAQHQLQFERFALGQSQQVRPEPAATPPYVPSGAPPVSAPAPVEAPPPAAEQADSTRSETYGWQAIEPASS
jgi:hypothetical protein